MQAPCPEDLPQSPIPPNPSYARAELIAALVIALIIGLIAWYDIWALRHGKVTVSQRILHWSQRHLWARVLLLAGMIMLTWHWVWGFPYSWRRRK